MMFYILNGEKFMKKIFKPTTRLPYNDHKNKSLFTLYERKLGKTVIPCCKFNKTAFTLAEVLITLAVIGVVAAMTMPLLIQHFKDKVLITQVKKSYTNFLNVIERMKAENGTTDVADLFVTGEEAEQIAKNIASFYNGSNVCSGANKGCGSSYKVKTSKPMNNGNGGITKEDFGFPRINIVDGSSIYLRDLRKNCDPMRYEYKNKDSNGFHTGTTSQVTDYRCATVVIDVNGEYKGPNQYGADVHQIIVYKNNLDIKGSDSNYGSMKDVFVKNKLNYKNYPDNYKFNR